MKKRVRAFVAVQYPESRFPLVATFYCSYYKADAWTKLIDNNRTDESCETKADTKKRLMKAGWRVLPCYIEVEL